VNNSSLIPLYKNIKHGKFISRPNRFIANIEINGRSEVCHVKNTGRCKELLVKDAVVLVQEFPESFNRKTKYDLISVYKGDRLINIDSQAPNKVFYSWLLKSNLLKNVTLIKPEVKYKNSRFDFYIEAGDRKILIEVKGVTLEEKGVALFPDAPTERGVKHITELIKSLSDGFEAWVVFVIQMRDVQYFTPNTRTHKAFSDILKTAKKQGVKIMAIDCEVTESNITAKDFVDVKLDTRGRFFCVDITSGLC
jgi:sugar fermentation stimulation protein A